jgi:hypothetical protein
MAVQTMMRPGVSNGALAWTLLTLSLGVVLMSWAAALLMDPPRELPRRGALDASVYEDQ